MKRRLTWYVGIAGIILATATWVSAATMEDIVNNNEPWFVYSNTTAKVSKLGTDRSEGLGSVEFTADGPFSGTFSYSDHTDHDYTGNFVLSPNGKKLTMELDEEGRIEFYTMMAEWLYDAAWYYEGIELENIWFFPDKKGVVLSPVKISQKTNSPTKGKVSAKGTVSADVVGYGTIWGKYSFKSTIKFFPQYP